MNYNKEKELFLERFGEELGEGAYTLTNDNPHEIADYFIERMKEREGEIVEKLERFFTPATGSRGQGGLPVTGSVVDWTYRITKEGWEQFKSGILSQDNQSEDGKIKT